MGTRAPSKGKLNRAGFSFCDEHGFASGDFLPLSPPAEKATGYEHLGHRTTPSTAFFGQTDVSVN
jgi:hypothetical protein